MANQNNFKKANIMDKNVDIEPSGVIYNIRTSAISEFVEDFLTKKGVDGISLVGVNVDEPAKHGSSPYVSAYLFLNQSSKHIISDINNIPQMLRNKVDKINIRLSDDIKQILYPLCGTDIRSGKVDDNGEFFIQLNIFRVIGLMFAANPNQHKLVISDAKCIPNARDAIISVIKYEKSNYSSNTNSRHDRIMDQLDKRYN